MGKIFSDAFSKIISDAKKMNNKTIAFPEGNDNRIIECIKQILKTKLCKVVVLGEENLILRKLGLPKSNEFIKVIDPVNSVLKSKLASELYLLRKHKGLTEETARDIIKEPIYFAMMLLKTGEVDGVVAGAVYHTADVLRPAFQIIKCKPDVNIASSAFLMEVPDNAKFTKEKLMVFADCAVVTYPNADQLVDIALESAETAVKIAGINPRVAFLSYSTSCKSSDDQNIIKIKEAVKKLKLQKNNLVVEGEIQADAALDEIVRNRKDPDNSLKQNANVLIFPDINSGNISYKLVQKFAGVKAVGPIIQGLNKPVSDLSRSATVEEIYLTTAVTLLQTV